MTSTPEIKMLDWKKSLARSGAELVHAHLASGGAPAECAVLLPGRRFRRHFQSALLDAAIASGSGGALESPRMLTAAGVVEAFLDSDSTLRAVDDSVSLLFWGEAFRTLGRDAGVILGRGPDDSLALSRVAPLRQVCEELDAIGRTPEDLVGADFEIGSDERWRALGALRHRAHELLRTSGLVERTFERRRMIDHRDTRPDAPAVLFVLGVTDPGPLTSAVIGRFSDRVQILLEAPSSARDDFDDFGRPRPEIWSSRPSVVPREEMSLVDRPIDAAEVIFEQLACASETSPLNTSEFVVGLCDERQAGILERCGRRADVPLRAAAGTSMSHCEVARLLDGFSTYLDSPDIETFSELIRLPSLERALTHDLEQDPVLQLDSWRERRIGGTLDDLFLLSSADDRGGDDVLQEILRRLDLMLSPVKESSEIRGRMLATGGLLRTIFGADRAENEVSLALDGIEALLGTLNSCEGIPFIAPSALFAFLSRTVKSMRLPAPPVDPTRGAIEMLGWLDVRNDPASNIILVGFNDSGELGPAPSDGWLTQSLRDSLGLPSEVSRRARDIHAMHAIAARTSNLHVIVNRHDHRGDPVVPSRLFLGSGGDESARRVMSTMSEQPRSFPAHRLSGTTSPAAEPGFIAPPMPDHELITRLRVTDFASWLRSPRRFWLERFKKLRTIESNHLELDARAFGTLAHDVLEKFGRSALRDSTDESRIISLIESDLDELVARRYGRPCTPAIEIQRRMLRDRLRRFAVIQARDAAEGWRCHCVEESLECPLDIPGQDPVTLVGRIDRIDRHQDGRWRVLDYKTSERAVTASSKRDRKGVWNDLQLPLYDLLMRETIAGPDALIELGYVSLPRDLLKVDFSVATKWDPAIIESGIELARTIVCEMRSADFSRPSKGRGYGQEVDGIDRILRSSVLVMGEDDQEEGES